MCKLALTTVDPSVKLFLIPYAFVMFTIWALNLRNEYLTTGRINKYNVGGIILWLTFAIVLLFV